MIKSDKPSALLLILAYTAVYFVWGTSYLAIVYALKGLPPFLISAIRYLAAGLLLSCWLWYRKNSWPDRKDRKTLVISGILMLSGGSGLVVFGEQYISSGCAAVIVATEPLFFVLFDQTRWRAYFSNRLIIAGLVTGFAGIILFAHFSPPSDTFVPAKPFLGFAITLISAMCWVTGALYANKKLLANAGTIGSSTVQLLAAGLFSGLIAGSKGEFSVLWSGTIHFSAWAGLTYLVVMGSLVAYLSFNWLITVQPPAIVSTHTFVNPVIAVFMGWLLVSEKVTVSQLIALAVVLTGVVITQLSKQKMP